MTTRRWERALAANPSPRNGACGHPIRRTLTLNKAPPVVLIETKAQGVEGTTAKVGRQRPTGHLEWHPSVRKLHFHLIRRFKPANPLKKSARCARQRVEKGGRQPIQHPNKPDSNGFEATKDLANPSSIIGIRFISCRDASTPLRNRFLGSDWHGHPMPFIRRHPSNPQFQLSP